MCFLLKIFLVFSTHYISNVLRYIILNYCFQEPILIMFSTKVWKISTKYTKCHLNLLRNMSTADKTVITEEIGDKGVITLNRPKALNAINLDMVRQIYAAMQPWESQKSLVLIKGAGEKSFCAGGDVRAVVENGATEDSKNFFREEYRLNALIGSYKIPYVAIIDGITMGGGVGLSVHGKYRVATERTLFAMPETAIGLFPDVGGGHFLPRMNGKLGLFLGLTGFRLKGKDVLKAGVSTHYIESANLPDLEKALLATKSDSQVAEVLKKHCVEDKSEFVLAKNMDQINRCFSASTVEGIMENLEKDGSDFSKNALKLLAKMSPTSLKVTKLQLDLGAKMTLEECLKMEFRLAVNHCINSDFKEGVRALLVDRDQNPQWNPKSLAEVSQAHVESFFRPLAGNDELKFKL